MKGSLRRRIGGMFYGKRRWQRWFERLHSIALSGMNYGSVECPIHGEGAFLRSVRREIKGRPAVIVDVGANDGLYAEQVLEIFGDDVALHCFEPSEAAFRKLERFLSGRPNVRLHRCALGEVPGRGELHTTAEGDPGSSLYAKEPPGVPPAWDRIEPVEVRRLDDLFGELALGRIDLLKVDAEGHDLFVLRGARKWIEEGRISRIQFEFGEANLVSRTCLQDFHRLLGPRYRLFRVLRDGLRPVEPYRIHAEVFIAANYVALVRAGEEAGTDAG